jgi:hypothetical protein
MAAGATQHLFMNADSPALASRFADTPRRILVSPSPDLRPFVLNLKALSRATCAGWQESTSFSARLLEVVVGVAGHKEAITLCGSGTLRRRSGCSRREI